MSSQPTTLSADGVSAETSSSVRACDGRHSRWTTSTNVASTVAALPALAMLWWLRTTVRALETPPRAPGAADD